MRLAWLGWTAFGVAGLAFAVVAMAPMMWPVSWVRVSGVRGIFHTVLPGPDGGSIWVVERSSIGHGHSLDVDRLHRLDLTNGASLGPTCVVGIDFTYAGPLGAGLLVRSRLHDGDMGSRYLRVLEPLTCRERDDLRAALDTMIDHPEVTADGTRLIATGRDGRRLVLDVVPGAAAGGAVEPRRDDDDDAAAPRWHRPEPTTSIATLAGRTLTLVGDRRRRLQATDDGRAGHGAEPKPADTPVPDFLGASFVADAAGDAAVTIDDALLVAHHAALAADGSPVGLRLSAIRLDGSERWRFVAGDGARTLRWAQRVGDAVVVATAVGGGDDAELFALELATGRPRWRVALAELPP